MLFTSIEFLLFLPTVFILYWFVVNKNLWVQNLFLLITSYFFYGWWDWRFLSLIFFSTCVDYIIGLNLGKNLVQKKRKLLLWSSILVNVGLLGIFKYYNFFAESFAQAFSLFGVPFEAVRLNIILPIGISFYTFQTLSYSIDIYKKKLEPTKNFIAFAAFVSFFPQLVAGPIERAANLLPQFLRKRTFEYEIASKGMRQILWGLFKKLVIADNCAVYVDYIFANHSELSGFLLIIGVILFVYQIYGDFSGYSDIAIGTSKLFGFNLMQNFNYPFFSKNMTEFYRRWHISLSTWIRDYVYTPLNIEIRGMNKKYRYIVVFIITFTIFGFWHGANWTYIVFGILQGIILSFEYGVRKWRKKMLNSSFGNIYSYLSVFCTFAIWSFSCLIFRASTLTEAVQICKKIFMFDDYFSLENLQVDSTLQLTHLGLFILGFLLTEWFQKKNLHELILNYMPVRWFIYFVIVVIILLSRQEQKAFIYFQF